MITSLASFSWKKIKRQRTIFTFIVLGFIAFIYFEINVNVQGTYFWRQIGRCRNTVEDDDSLRYLIISSHEIFDKLKLPHFLVYGSLWGAIRYSDPLPWDYDYDMGILYEDLIKIDVDRLFYEFKKKDIRIFYQNYAGNYKVVKGHMTGDIMIFRDYYNDGVLRRIGIESWLLFIHYRYYHQFPKKLVERPLPTMKFAGSNFDVPLGGLEIQKYFYPRNWWKEVVPTGCFLNKTSKVITQ